MSHVTSEFWDLIELNRESLWRFSLGLTSDPDEAADLMSDTIIAAQKSFRNLRSEQAFKSFLFTIAHRLYRRRTWRRRIFGKLEEAAHIQADLARESRYDLELLLAVLSTLPEKQREAILLFDISGFSIEEIQGIQGGSISAVKVRLFRGRETLRKKLLEDPQRETPSTPLILPQTL